MDECIRGYITQFNLLKEHFPEKTMEQAPDRNKQGNVSQAFVTVTVAFILVVLVVAVVITGSAFFWMCFFALHS